MSVPNDLSEHLVNYILHFLVFFIKFMCCLHGFFIYLLYVHFLVFVGYRAPNPDTVLIIQTPLGVFSTKNLLQDKRHTGSRLISSNRLKLQETSTMETNEVELFSAARCRIFKRSDAKVPWNVIFL